VLKNPAAFPEKQCEKELKSAGFTRVPKEVFVFRRQSRESGWLQCSHAILAKPAGFARPENHAGFSEEDEVSIKNRIFNYLYIF